MTPEIASSSAPPAPGAARPCADAGLDALREAIVERVLRLGAKVTFDFKELLTQTRFARSAGIALWALIRRFEPEVLVAPGFGGAPLLFATALAAFEQDGVDLALWMVRDQRKGHFRKRWIEGPRFDRAPRVVMLDDFIGHGSAVALVDQALAEEKMAADLRAIAVLYDESCWDGARQLSVSRCPVVSVFRRQDLGLTRDCHDARPPTMKGSAPPLVGQPLWWRFAFNGATDKQNKCAPAIADGALFAADDLARLWRFDAVTGEPVWCRESIDRHPKGIVQRLQHAQGSVVYGAYDGTVTRLDDRTGQVLWRWKIDSFVHATPALDLDGGRVFVNTESSGPQGPGGSLVAMDWATGRTLWRHRHAFWAAGSARHDAASGSVVAPCNDESLVCVDAASGAPRWRVVTDGLVRGHAAIAGGSVIVCTENGWLQAFDLATGALLRSRRSGIGGRLHQFTRVEDGLVYAFDENAHFAAFDANDLRLRWISKLRSPASWQPVRWGHYLIVLSRRGELAAFDTRSGTKTWEGHVGGEYRQSPAIGLVDGEPLLVCASHHDGLKAFRLHSFYSQ